MQIGTFRFEVPGAEYHELSRQYQRRWAARERHGAPPVLEDLGRGADALTLTGTLWVRRAADLDAFAALREDAGLDPDGVAEPLAVFLGGGGQASGDYLGLWVVEQLHVRERQLRLDAVPSRVDFSVRLREYTVVAP